MGIRKKKMKLILSLITISILLSSCATEIILPGLCYTDDKGTFLCPEIDRVKPPISPEPLPPTELQELWKECEPFLSHDGEFWMNCILIA